jgi:hypothetical protein
MQISYGACVMHGVHHQVQCLLSVLDWSTILASISLNKLARPLAALLHLGDGAHACWALQLANGSNSAPVLKDAGMLGRSTSVNLLVHLKKAMTVFVHKPLFNA